jgi:hypothetical protein
MIMKKRSWNGLTTFVVIWVIFMIFISVGEARYIYVHPNWLWVYDAGKLLLLI